MRILAVATLVLMFLCCAVFAGCSAKMDQKIRENVNLGLDNPVKAKDMAQEIAVIGSMVGDPVLKWYYQQKHFTASVSHGVVTLTGKLRTQELIDQAVDLASRVKGIKEVNNELELDPTIEEQPFEW